MRIFKRGKSWYVDYLYKGKRTRKSVGRSKRVAELKLKDIELRIAKKEHLGIDDERKILLKDFVKDYLEYSSANKTYESHRRDKTSLKNLIPVFGDLYLFKITTQMIEHYKSRRLNKVEPATVNRELSCLKHIYTKAIEWGYVKENPARKVKLLKEPVGRLRYLEMEDIHRLINSCSKELRPIVLVALNTGMRKGEILNLKWENIDFKNRLMSLEKTKTNERRIIPMNDLLFKTIKKLLRKSEYLFPYKNNGIPLKNVRKSFASALKKANIEDFRFHDLRHTFASQLAMNGFNLITIKDLLGHKSLRTTMRYAHLSRSHLRDAVQKVGTKMAQYEHRTSKTLTATVAQR